MMFSEKIFVLLLYFISSGLYAQENFRYYEFSAGSKCCILEYKANIMAKPSMNSNVIAILSANDIIEILENSEVEERINGVLACWYKVKYGNIVGYTFGGNISESTLVTDIDKNGINDYFHFRYNDYGDRYRKLNASNDVVIYINNNRIRTEELWKQVDDYDRNYGYFWRCYFKEDNDAVIIEILCHYKVYDNLYIYKVNKTGAIEFIRKDVFELY